ncbi:class III poly(R)-hydroxyalkanoic acid synthase subunit PhaC [Desulfobotulus sp.]|jgi:polyhydroxyalkanoate synthase|uniref:class III poly(R)-hydroxyalkanoic acid synthase subunit PhaC n=1 Tax=Desulfobotulus sp. TaxID=1940337 RepID=UPI002A36AE56|nr:class III poly(R)-hydroxyalkanoic acid synthase subunit PhaC [Desulfobotulus sp.]MDY0161744.1 class III poly(R)-hydroxyalkanoic acid synthase subunit PhaC [Desulfobotulus sp.]
MDMGKLTDKFLTDLENNTEKTQAYLKDACDVLLSALDDNIASTPYEIVWQEDRVRLKFYRSTAKDKAPRKTPILVVYALINRETMLDLQPGRSVVEKFLADGMDVYMLDWGYPTQKDKFLTIDDHVNVYLDDAVDFIREREKAPCLNLMGICMGGTFCTIYAAIHPEKVKNLVLTVTPTSFDHDKGLLHVWMRDLDADSILKNYGNMPGDLMNFGFLLLNPARLMIDKYRSFLQNLGDKAFVENFVRMERWIYDSPDVPGETFRQFIEDLYKKNLLIQNKMQVGPHLVNLQNVTMPVLNIYARFDHLVPPAASEQITSRVASKDTKDLCLDTGHIGIYVSSKYQNEFVPTISRWLLERDAPAETASLTEALEQSRPEEVTEGIRKEKKSHASPAGKGRGASDKKSYAAKSPGKI